jgi:glycosyltransferase involved in cell wall biosynthesis
VPWGVGAEFLDVFTRVGRRPAGVPDRYVLHVGARRSHKNQKVLVAALAELRGSYPGVGLVLAGQHDPRVPDEAGELIAELGLSDHVRQYTRAGDDTLLDLYANTRAVDATRSRPMDVVNVHGPAPTMSDAFCPHPAGSSR